MGLLDTSVIKATIKDSIEMVITDIQFFSDDEKQYIEENLVEIAKGRDSNFPVKTIAKKILKFMSGQDIKTINGAAAEFFLVCILRKQGYSQEYCYRNLEENSIKKGFDGVFIKDDVLWLAESKSSDSLTVHDNKHQVTISKAYRGISKQLCGGGTNDPWENAANHARATRSSDALIKRLTQLSVDYTDDNYQSIEKSNVILGSTVIATNISMINKETSIIEGYLNNHVANNELVVVVNLRDSQILTQFLEEVGDGK